MSRFADTGATRTVDLGACECPGTPHASDTVLLRSDLSGAELGILLRLDALDQEEQAAAILPFLTEWNLLGPDGEPAALDAQALYDLKGPTANVIGEAIGEVIRENLNLPNTSGAPSRASSRGSASRTRTSTRSRTR